MSDHKHHRRSLFFIIVPLLALVIAVFVSAAVKAPEFVNDGQPHENNSQVEVKGNFTCLSHLNTEGPQTLECAIGFQDEFGNYYAIESDNYDVFNQAFDKQVVVSGTYTSKTSDRYRQSGSIKVSSVELAN